MTKISLILFFDILTSQEKSSPFVYFAYSQKISVLIPSFQLYLEILSLQILIIFDEGVDR